jgi:hypothetical protein
MLGRLLTIAISLIPIWWFRYFATQDGPAHVYNAALTRWIDAGGPASELFWYGFNTAGNAATHWLLWLMLPAMAPETAWKLVASLCVVGLWIGFWRLLRAFEVTSLMPSVLLAPAVYSLLLHMGFCNFLLGAGLAMWAMAWAVEWRCTLTVRRMLAMAGILAALYLCHAMMWALATAWCAAWAGRQCWRVAVACLPGAALLASYSATAASAADVGGPVPGMALGDRIIAILTLESLHCFSKEEIAVNLFGAALFWGMLAWLLWRRRGHFEARDALLGLSLAALAARMAGPNDLRSGAYLWVREHWLFMIAALLWMATEMDRRRLKTPVAALFVIWGVALCAARWPVMRDANKLIGEYRSIEGRLPPDAVTLTMTRLDDERFTGIGVLQQGYGYLLNARPVAVNNYEAMSDHFAVRFHGGKSALGTAGFLRGRVEGINARTSVTAYERKTGVRVDALVLWGDARPEGVGEFEEIVRNGRVRALKRKGRPAGGPSSLD